MKQTKIVATHGPAISSQDELYALYDAGVNVVRFNFSHAQYDTVREVLESMRKGNRSGRTAMSMLLDTKGPEIRTGDLPEKQNYARGDVFHFYSDIDAFQLDGSSLFCDYPYLIAEAYVGQVIDVDSGLFQVEVQELFDDKIQVKALNDATIGSRRHINLPGQRLKMPGITQKDKEDIAFAVEESMDFIAMSFVRSGENVRELRAYLKELGGEQIKIISKIENQEGIEKLAEIIDESDGIMVARGDLGIEVPIEKLPTYQANMVRDTLAKGKFTIIATHLLESMIDNPFPTRAEVSDIYNSVMQRSDALMLSGETAAGKFPHKSVEVMHKTIVEAEKNLDYPLHEYYVEKLTERDIEKKSLIKSAILSGQELGVEAIFIFTKSGKLARLASSFRPGLPILAFTMHLQSVAYMNALFGVHPFLIENWDPHFEQNVDRAVKICKEQALLKNGDRVMVVNDIQKGDREIPLVEILDIL